jgi:ubiquinone/menaquinone biosynthesis C-methylase UbiE
MFQSNRTVAKSEIDQLDLETRMAVEAQITDARAEAVRFDHFANMDTSLEHYAARYLWRQYLFGFLGPVENKVVLDIACGYSMTPVMFALAGAKKVYAVDVAPKTIATVKRFAEFKGVGDRLAPHVGPVETLPFEDETFDLIYGGAALHHLQIDKAGRELARVLKRGGKGGFQDPLGHNMLLEFARDYIPYNGKHPVKGTDRPLRLEQVAAFGRYFTTCHYRGFELFAMLSKPLRLKRNTRRRRAVEALDRVVLAKVPHLQRYTRFVVTCVTK